MKVFCSVPIQCAMMPFLGQGRQCIIGRITLWEQQNHQHFSASKCSKFLSKCRICAFRHQHYSTCLDTCISCNYDVVAKLFVLLAKLLRCFDETSRLFSRIQHFDRVGCNTDTGRPGCSNDAVGGTIGHSDAILMKSHSLDSKSCQCLRSMGKSHWLAFGLLVWDPASDAFRSGPWDLLVLAFSV